MVSTGLQTLWPSFGSGLECVPLRGLNHGYNDLPSTQVNHSPSSCGRAFLTTTVACSMTSIILFVVYVLPSEPK